MSTSTELQEIDLYTLCESQSLRVIIREGLFDDSFLFDLKNDCDRIIGPLESLTTRSDDQTILHPAGFGQLMSLSDASIRGDFTTWLTPELCRDRHLETIPRYIKRSIRLLKPLKEKLGLNDDYSAQLAVYVSYLLCLSTSRNN
jgi:hypothetical protein